MPLGAGPRRGVPPRPRGALRLRRPRPRARARRGADGRRPPGPELELPRASAARRGRARPGRARRRDLLGPPGWVGARDGSHADARARRVNDRAPGARQRAARRRRGDGRRAHPLGVLGQHQGAARLLDRALRRARADDRPGRAHPGSPRRDARRGRRGRCARPGAGRGLHPQRPVAGGTHLPDITLVSRTRARLRRHAARTTPTSAARSRQHARRLARRSTRRAS